MSKRNKNSGGFVYSTNSNFNYGNDNGGEEETLLPNEQELRIWLEKKGGNKITSIVRGFIGTEADLKDLGKQLKSACGTGGSVKNGEIIIQGDHRDKIQKWLNTKGYNSKKSGG